MKRNLYRGFSSRMFMKNRSFVLNDIELVKQDLLNHIWTRLGERPRQPKFGTSIPEMIFEPLDPDMVDEVERQLMAVFVYDPRVEPISITSTPDYDNLSLSVTATLFYVELNMTGKLDLHLEFGSAA